MSDKSKPAEKPPEPQSIKDDATAKNPPNPPPLPPAQDRPTGNTPADNEHKNLTIWECFERIVKVIECLALIGGVATAFFIGYQWQEMRKASGDAEKALDLTSQQLKAMQTQSEVMQGQLDEMKIAREDDERAWVTAYDVEAVNGDGFTFFAVDYKNTGKTPAMYCQAVCYTTNSVTAIPAKDTFANNEMYSGLLAPDGIQNVDTRDEKIPSVEAIAIRNGSQPYYLYGTIRYQDIFSSNHWSRFCFKVGSRPDGSFEFTITKIQNSCDDAQTNQP